MDTDSFVINIKIEDFYKDIAGDVERWLDTSNFDKQDELAFLRMIQEENPDRVLCAQSKSICIQIE